MLKKDQGFKFGFQRLAELKALKDQNKRVFGKEITNLNKRSKNFSIHEVPAQKAEHKPRALSFKKDKQQSELKIKNILQEYQHQIVGFILTHEKKPNSTFKNEEISQKNRQVLFDWLIDIHEAFKLKEETLFLAFSYLTDFLHKVHIPKDKLQLAGVTSLWIASKYQEIYPPRTKNYVQVAGSSFTIESLKQMESQIIQALDFNLTRTTPLCLAEMVLQNNTKTASLCKYLLEASQLQGYCRNVAPSLLVITAVKLSDYICKTTTSDRLLKDACSYEKEQMTKCFKELCNVLQSRNKYGLIALKKKFNTEKFHFVSKVKLQPK